MKNTLLTVSVLCISLIGCNSKKYDELTYLNDFEQISGWFSVPMIVNGFAHSGNYSYQIDSEKMYGLTFKKSFSEISSKKLNKIIIKTWVLVKDIKADGKIVVDIQDSTGKSFGWNGTNTNDFISTENEWTLITAEINIPPDVPQTKDYFIVFFGWNVGKIPFWIDDMQISFE